MGTATWAEHKGRLLVLVGIGVLYAGLLMLPLVYGPISFGEEAIRYGVGCLIGLLFLCLGALVWLYASNRRVAAVWFGWCVAMMVTFTVLGVSQIAALASVSTASSALAIGLFAVLVLLFPHDFLFQTGVRGEQQALSKRRAFLRLLLRMYVTLLAVWTGSIVVLAIVYWQAAQLPPWGELAVSGFSATGLIGSLVTLLLASLRRDVSLQERQQRRLLIGGTLLAVLPFMVLTLLPTLLGFPAHLIVGGELSALSIAILPLVLAYAILRYQILALDRYLRRVVGWLGGGIAVGLLGYVTIVVYSLVQDERVTVFLLLVALGLGIATWNLAVYLAERLFFPEARHYHRLLAHPGRLGQEVLNVQRACSVLVQQIKDTFETTAACVFMLNEDPEHGAQCFHLIPVESRQVAHPMSDTLAQRVLATFALKSAGESGASVAVFASGTPAIEQLTRAARPLYASEIAQDPLDRSRVRFLVPSVERFEADPLLAPIRAQGRLIGILALGRRGNHHSYAGPEFDALELLLAQFAPILEAARLYERETRQQARINAELTAAIERQRSLDKLKDQFMMTASHELRTPLTAVEGYLELLQAYQGRLSAAQMEDFLAKAQRGCEELVLMVNNIMDASRVQVDGQQVQRREVSLPTCIVQVLEILDVTLRRGGHQALVEMPERLVIWGDDLRVRQVLLNLITNACKYTPPGTAIHLAVRESGGLVEVRVRDFGPGIRPEEQAHLFERFTRLERDMNSPIRGAGLGLYICKQLVEAMGGRIWIESSGLEGEGCSFVFTLPLAVTKRTPPVEGTGPLVESENT